MKEMNEKSALESWLSRGKTEPSILAFFTAASLIFISFFHIFTGLCGQIDTFTQRQLAVTSLLVATLLNYPLGRKTWGGKLNKFFVIDAILIGITISGFVYYLVARDEFVLRTSTGTAVDHFVGMLTILLVLEATRRLLGLPLVISSLVFLGVVLFANHLPGFLYGPAMPWSDLVEMIYMAGGGIYGMPIGVVTGYLIAFMVFVAMLLETGGGKLFIDIAISLTGRWTGGPAKTAVIASGLFGTASGSAIANVVGTGSVTIPMMKGLGYKPQFAGAVEAVASSGGQLMPPVMGAAAFLMAEFTGISYGKICLYAAIPAILYYFSVFMMVHFQSLKSGLVGLPPSQVPSVRWTIKRGWPSLAGIAVLIIGMVQAYSLSMCALAAAFSLFVFTSIKKETRLTPERLLKVLERGGKMSLDVGIACACVGIIIGAVYASGLDVALQYGIIKACGGQLFLALLVTAVTAILLGMAIPTAAVYVTVFLIAIPVLIKLGVNVVAAHLFAFYFGIVSGLTPPVCLPAYVAAGIAGAPMMRTGFESFKLGIASYFIPFAFVYIPALLLQGPRLETAIHFPLVIVGLTGIASAVVGRSFFRNANWLERIALMGAGIGTLGPSVTVAAIGAAVCIVLIAFQKKSV